MEVTGIKKMKKMKSGPGGGARRGREKPPLAVLRSRQTPRKTWFNCAMIRQPTLVVAWVGTCWHASAHKGCPVFPRWAPGLNAIAEADDRCCPRGNSGHPPLRSGRAKYGNEIPQNRRLRTQGVRPSYPERIGLGSPLAIILRYYSREDGTRSRQRAHHSHDDRPMTIMSDAYLY